MSCESLPSLVSSFIDTFIDFSVSGGLFLPPEPPSSPNPTVFPQPTRLVAIGDIHGDLAKAKQALKLANLIDTNDRWIGGSTTVVQVGDILDRGGEEIKLLYLFEKLKREAAKSGGMIITMNGNHEIMNVDGDFRYVTSQGFKEFEDWAMWQCVGNVMKRMCNGVEHWGKLDLYDGVPSEFARIGPDLVNGVRARVAALRPNGPISSRFLAGNQTVVVVGDSVFAHGGLMRNHVVYGLERVNEEVRDWIRGVREKVGNELVRGRDSIVWLRRFSDGKDCDCSMLEHVLETIPGARRMIMGHTIQNKGINGVCGDRAVRIDVGMSAGCGGKFPEVLEITEGSQVRILTSNPKYSKGYEAFKHVKKDGLGSLIPEERPRQVEVNA